MDSRTSSRLREQRAHQRAQIAEKWQERAMKEFENQEKNRQNKEKAPQMIEERECQMGSQGMGGTIKEVRKVYRSPA